MALKSREKMIGEVKYRYTQQKLTPATELFAAVVNVASGGLLPVAAHAPALFAMGGDDEFPPNLLQSLASAVAGQIGNSATVLDIIRRINASGEFIVPSKGKEFASLADEEVAEIHFGANLEHLPPWIAFALEVQFGPFLKSLVSSAVGEKLRGLMATKAAEPASPSA